MENDNFMKTWDLVDQVPIGSAIWYQMGPLMKVIPHGCTVPVSNRSRVNRVDPYKSGSDPKRI